MRVVNIQRFCMHDGPGIRTTVFFKGCPLRCAWCHNAETQRSEKEILFYKNKCIFCHACESVCTVAAHSFEKEHELDRSACIKCGKCTLECPTGALELCGEDISVLEIFEEIKKDRSFYGNEGGVTLSGGEVFMQSREALELLKLCKSELINTAVETCGYFQTDIMDEAIPLTDLFLWDIKDTDDERHKQNTGVSKELILKNLYYADSIGAKTRIRAILINGVNALEEHYEALADIVKKLNHCEGVEFIPYHPYGTSKSTALGKNTWGDNSLIPSKEQINAAKECLIQKNIRVF